MKFCTWDTPHVNKFIWMSLFVTCQKWATPYQSVVPHKAVVEVSKTGHYRRGELLWCMDGRANPLIHRKLVEVKFFPRASERRVLPIVGVCISSSHLHTFSSSHLLILTSAHLHICSTSAHLHFLHTRSSSHLLIFTSAHLHICSSSHLLIFTSAHLHICSSSHLHIFSLSPFSLLFLSLAFFIFLSLGRGWYRRWVTKRQPFRTKRWSICKNWGKIAILLVLE